MFYINQVRILHLHYVYRSVKGLRSTGLEADVYDVVITAGGFAKARGSGHLVF